MTHTAKVGTQGLFIDRELLHASLGLDEGDEALIESERGLLVVRAHQLDRDTEELLEFLSTPPGTLKQEALNPDEEVDLEDEIGGDIYDELLD